MISQSFGVFQPPDMILGFSKRYWLTCDIRHMEKFWIIREPGTMAIYGGFFPGTLWDKLRFGHVEITLWLCQNSYWKWPFIVDFPIKNGGFP